ncbi:MAG: chain length determinant protein EpsF [Burkholderiales bacterium]
MTLSRFVQVLRARWRLALMVIAASLVVAAALTALVPREYKSTAALLIDMRSSDPLASAAAAAFGNGALSTGYMATQMDLLQSERVTLRAMKLSGLDHSPVLKARWQAATDSRGSFETWLSEQMRKKVDVLPTRESGMMTISFTASDAKTAADVANAYVRAFIDITLELRVEPAKRYADFFDDRVKQLRATLNAAQAKLATYQQASGIVATDERLDVEVTRLSEMSSQLSAWQAASADSRSRKQASAGPNGMPEVAADPVLIGLSSELARQQLRVSEMRQRLGESNPQLQDAEAAVAQLRSQIAAESRRLSGGLAASAQINQSREAQLSAMLDEQRAKVLRMKRARDDASVLVRDVESAKAAYDAMMARAGQSGMESLNTQTNVSVVQVATEPLLPYNPKPVANMVVATVLGCLLALAVVLVREISSPKLRTADDVAIDLQLKLLVVLPSGARGGSVTSHVRDRILDRLPRSLAALPNSSST